MSADTRPLLVMLPHHVYAKIEALSQTAPEDAGSPWLMVLGSGQQAQRHRTTAVRRHGSDQLHQI